MSAPTSSHAYGIGLIALIIGMSASVVFYTSFYLPESLAKPSVSDHILHPEDTLLIEIVPGAVIEGNENYVPNKATATLEFTNLVVWQNNDDTAHTVTPDHRHSDSVTVETLVLVVFSNLVTHTNSYFTEPQEVPYHCQPHPWMTGKM